MSKKYTRYLSVVLLAIIVLLTLPLTINAESLRCKKIISVVYDDSGSMSGNNEAYANYSMQTFAAMVNKGDELYITYMSDCMNSRRIDTSDLLNAVGNIRNHASNGNTPYEAVETAMNRLKQSKDSVPTHNTGSLCLRMAALTALQSRRSKGLLISSAGLKWLTAQNRTSSL